MTKVMNNAIAEKMNEAVEFVAVHNFGRENVITAFGNEKETVYEKAYFHWAVVCNYEGNFCVLPANEVEVLN